MIISAGSKYPVPVNPNNIVFSSPVSLHFKASSIATLIACDDSGAGSIVSTLANNVAASNTLVCFWVLLMKDENMVEKMECIF